MRKILLMFLSLLLLQTSAMADNEQPIKQTELPTISQQFIKKHFSQQAIALIKKETEYFSKSYEVIFTNGNKVEFKGNGEWSEVDCKYTNVPSGLVPSNIKNYVNKNYPNTQIIKIEKKSRGRWEIELSNDLELKFDSQFNLIDID